VACCRLGAVALVRAWPAQPHTSVKDRGLLALYVMLIVSHALIVFLAA
jgi:hypothetical protein